ncbi:jg1615 [Pararge aegeria aegeria]|uniref:Jg1615 protein n=1 Tax=Pararge aegeria aegeria TaxID=348720 RepID=A0A8S4RCE1_9NEOP|nr:jg1615 [Pararge aegeria aegeria]
MAQFFSKACKDDKCSPSQRGGLRPTLGSQNVPILGRDPNPVCGEWVRNELYKYSNGDLDIATIPVQFEPSSLCRNDSKILTVCF